MFHSNLLLCRRISFSPPPATFREALLRPKITDCEAHEADLHADGNPAGNQQHTRRHARPSSGSLPSTRRRVSARGSFSSDGTPHTGSSGAVLVFYPSGGPTRALLIHLLALFASAALRLALFASAALRQLYSLRFGSSFSSSSSSTAVIRPLIKALFNPNVVQSPVKWIWQLKILFLLLLSLDLLLSHQKN